MHTTHERWKIVSIALATILAFGCSETTGLGGSNQGAIQVVASTLGAAADRDPDGFTASIDDGPPARLPLTGLVVKDLSAGSHTVKIGGIAANCSVTGDNPRDVGIVGSAPVLVVPFEVVCAPNVGSIRISTVTTGDELDESYTILMSPNRQFGIGSNGTATIADIRVGAVSLSVTNVAPNCEPVGAESRVVKITFGAKLDFEFAFRCVATGRFQIVTTTTGADPDENGYALEVSRPAKGTRSVIQLATNGTYTATGFPPGDYTLSLLDISNNCRPGATVLSGVGVTTGNATPVVFEVDCAEAKQIAYSTETRVGSKIRVVKSNGAGRFEITSQFNANFDPDWSPDGSRIAFTSDREGSRDIYAMDSDGGHVVRLTGGTGFNYRPAWSPDGQRILFVRDFDGNTEIYVMDADGGNAVRIANNPVKDDAPSWSPDGRRIVFQSRRGGLQRIWIMNSDGSDAQPMPFSVDGDRQPAWSPNGNKIAFARISAQGFNNIYTADIDGSNLKQITFNYPDASDPTWSPDGLQIAYSATYCEQGGFYYYSDCDVQVVLATTDGKILPSTPVLAKGRNPAWRR